MDVLGGHARKLFFDRKRLLITFHVALETEREVTMDGTGLVWVRQDGANSGKIMAPIGPIAAT